MIELFAAVSLIELVALIITIVVFKNLMHKQKMSATKYYQGYIDAIQKITDYEDKLRKVKGSLKEIRGAINNGSIDSGKGGCSGK